MLKGAMGRDKGKLIQRLAFLPTLDEINQMMLETMAAVGKQGELSWLEAETGLEYKLRAICKPNERSPVWELIECQGGQSKPLWRHQCSDALLLFNMVMGACGQSNKQIRGDGVMFVGDTRRSAGEKISDSFRHFSSTGETREINPPDLGFETSQHIKISGASNTPVAPEPARPCPAQEAPAPSVSSQIPRPSEPSEDAKLAERFQEIVQSGLQPDSTLFKTDINPTRTNFERKLLAGCPVDNDTQARFYAAVDGQATVNELISSFNWGRRQWVPVVWNLLRSNLVCLSTTQAGLAGQDAGRIGQSGASELEAVMAALTNAQTGLLTCGALLFLLNYEYHRCRRANQPLSMIVLKVNRAYSSSRRIDSQQLEEYLVKAIEQVRRKSEPLAHFEDEAFALLLPGSPLTDAAALLRRILDQLAQANLGADPAGGANPIIVGIVGMPDHARDIPAFLDAARSALVGR